MPIDLKDHPIRQLLRESQMRDFILRAVFAHTLVWICACQPDELSTFRSGPEGAETQKDAGSVNTSGFGTGDQSVIPDDDAEISYPSLEFYGSGNLTSRENNPIKMNSNYEIDRETVSQNITSFTSSDSHVNKEVVKLVGGTTYQRVTKEEMKTWREQFYFKPEGFLMYGKNAKIANKAGSREQYYSMPVPVVVVPADMARYDVLKGGTLKYDPITVTNAKSGGQYDVLISVYEEKREGDIIHVVVKAEIPKDTVGHQYGDFALPYTSNYKIDTKNKKILSVATKSYYYNTDRKARREITVGNQLCRWKGKDSVETFNNCKK